MSNNRHQEYIDQLPSDWDKVPVENLGHIYSGGTPSRIKPAFWNGSIPWVTPGEITNLREKVLTKTKESITPAGLNACAAKLIPPGSILVTSRATIGSVAIAGIELCTNQGFKSLVPQDGVNSDFYYYVFCFIRDEMVRLASGSTFDEISYKDFSRIVVPRPKPNEQKNIAKILDLLDNAIRKTEQIITKLKYIQAGLLHELLTRGVDENGELRDPVVHPEQFCNSPVGRIPKVWGIGSLSGLAIGGILNGIFKKPEDVGSGYLLVNVLDLYQDFGIDLSLVQRLKTSERNRQKYSVEEGDCFFTRSSLNMAGIAHCNVVRYVPEPTIFECHLMRIRPNKSLVVPEFLALWCRSTWARRFFMARARQVTMTTISQEDIGPLPVPLPPISEQVLIVRINDEYEKCIQREKRYLEKLIKIKSGLMHDLLTGKVRVPSDKEGE